MAESYLKVRTGSLSTALSTPVLFVGRCFGGDGRDDGGGGDGLGSLLLALVWRADRCIHFKFTHRMQISIFGKRRRVLITTKTGCTFSRNGFLILLVS